MEKFALISESAFSSAVVVLKLFSINACFLCFPQCNYKQTSVFSSSIVCVLSAFTPPENTQRASTRKKNYFNNNTLTFYSAESEVNGEETFLYEF